MVDITKFQKGICSKAPGADATAKAAAKANCEASMERADVKACTYDASQAKAAKCVGKLVPSIFAPQAAPVPTSGDDAADMLGRPGAIISDADVKRLITPEYIKGLMASKAKPDADKTPDDVRNVARLADVERVAAAGTYPSLAANLAAAKGGAAPTGDSGWQFGLTLGAGSASNYYHSVSKSGKAYTEPGFTNATFEPSYEQSAAGFPFVNPELRVFARKSLNDGMKLHFDFGGGYTNYRLKLDDVRRETLAIADVTHKYVAAGAALLFEAKISDTWTFAGGPAINASWNWMSGSPHKDVPLGNGLVMEGNELMSYLSLGVGGNAELRAQLSKHVDLIMGISVMLNGRFTTPTTFAVNPTENGEVNREYSSPFTGMFKIGVGVK